MFWVTFQVTYVPTIFATSGKKGPRPKWNIYKQVWDKNKKCLSVSHWEKNCGNFTTFLTTSVRENPLTEKCGNILPHFYHIGGKIIYDFMLAFTTLCGNFTTLCCNFTTFMLSVMVNFSIIFTTFVVILPLFHKICGKNFGIIFFYSEKCGKITKNVVILPQICGKIMI